MDSMQVYRGMDIGTAKPTAAEQAEVRYHLIDTADPWDDHDLATYQAMARQVIADIERRGRRALLVGGTALYLRSIVDDLTLPGQFPAERAALEAEADQRGVPVLHARLVELDPDAAARMEPTNRRRVVRALEVTLGSGRAFSSFGPGLDAHPPTGFRMVGLRWDRTELDDRIADRYREQVEAGFLAEVQRLLDGTRPLSRSAAQALGYKELAAHLAGECSLDEALDLAVRRTRRFARRQDRWFRRDPRIRWVDVTADPLDHLPQVREALAGPAE